MTDQPDNQESTPPVPDDFAKFDPEAYVRQRRDAEGRHYLNEELDREQGLRQPGRGRGRHRRSAADGDDDTYDVDPEAVAGFGGRLLGPLTRGEGIFLWSDVLREVGPVIGRFLPLIGCAVLLICLAVGGAIYLLVSSLTQH